MTVRRQLSWVWRQRPPTRTPSSLPTEITAHTWAAAEQSMTSLQVQSHTAADIETRIDHTMKIEPNRMTFSGWQAVLLAAEPLEIPP